MNLPALRARLARRVARWLPSGRSLVIAAPFGFLLVFFMVPFLAVLMISFASPTCAWACRRTPRSWSCATASSASS
jgi:hypothetical protein